MHPTVGFHDGWVRTTLRLRPRPCRRHRRLHIGVRQIRLPKAGYDRAATTPSTSTFARNQHGHLADPGRSQHQKCTTSVTHMSDPGVSVVGLDSWRGRAPQLAQLLRGTSGQGRPKVVPAPGGGSGTPAAQLADLSDPEYWAADLAALTDAIVFETHQGSAAGNRLGSGAVTSGAERLTLTVEEAAASLGISRASAYEAVPRGEFRQSGSAAASLFRAPPWTDCTQQQEPTTTHRRRRANPASELVPLPSVAVERAAQQRDQPQCLKQANRPICTIHRMASKARARSWAMSGSIEHTFAFSGGTP